METVRLKRFHREGEVGVRVRLVFQGEVPPLLFEETETAACHQGLQEHTVFVLCRGNEGAVRMAERAEEIERTAHVQILLSFHVKERQINGASAGMTGVFQYVAARDNVLLFHLRIKEGFHQGIGGVGGPADKVVNSRLGPVSVKDFQPEPQGQRLEACLFQSLGSLTGKEGQGCPVAVYAPAHKVKGGVVTDIRQNIRHSL